MTALRPVLLMTRPEAASGAFADALAAQTGGGFAVVISPLIGIEPCGPLPDMGGMRGVIFTSAHGVQAYGALHGPVGLPCFTVGAATAEAARALGFDPVSADGDADALVTLITARAPTGPLMHLHGTHSRGDVGQRLTCAGIETKSTVIYDQPLLDLSGEAKAVLTGPAPVIVPLFSPRTAARFAETALRLTSVWIAAMSPAVAEALGTDRGAQVRIAARPTGAEMRKVVAMLMEEARTLESRETPQ